MRNVFTIKSACFNEVFLRSSLAFERLVRSFMSREEVRIQSLLINTVVFQVSGRATGKLCNFALLNLTAAYGSTFK